MERRSCKLEKDSTGVLYNVKIFGEHGEVLTEVKSVTFARAVCFMEDYMHTTTVRGKDNG